ncbi:hypothetical protein CAC42_664 [Sphaceloma murrayae]|uniref:SET domain-containing protein n=1 Tax=Sphaceloma murrayae TaxID=2082308 RepID=A0A2K1QJS2_9PEZI|nr:hypothetical protein CAC42_664 [Sphaceloma murrayae]
MTPIDWPTGVAYTSEPIYSDHVTLAMQKALHTPTAATASWPKVGAEDLTVPCEKVRIHKISSTSHPNHPAAGQHGLFAAHHLPPGSFILPYIGQVHTNSTSDTDATSDYDLSMDREMGISIDAAKVGNESRFMNDYRGVAEGPNVEFRDCWIQIPARNGESRGRWERRIGVFVLPAGKAGKRRKGIGGGEEIVVNYGKGFWRGRVGQNADDEG